MSKQSALEKVLPARFACRTGSFPDFCSILNTPVSKDKQATILQEDAMKHNEASTLNNHSQALEKSPGPFL